jgi:hypothetical protein
MMTDEEILHKATLLLEHISEKTDLSPKSLLREVNEDELRAIAKVLERIAEDPNGILAFDDLFGDRVRFVVPFPVKDANSELGQFVYDLEQDLKVEPDYDNGMISLKREWVDHSDRSSHGQPTETSKTLRKNIKMKIGKYFVKLDELAKEWKEIRQKIGERLYKDPPRLANARWSQHYDTVDEMQVLDHIELKRLNQLRNQLELYVGSALPATINKYIMSKDAKEKWIEKEQLRRDLQDKGDIEHNKEPRKRKPIVPPDTEFKVMGDYWVNKAKWIKENINTLENSQYSIIMTRHPIDIMRMSDFENITSCHTPPSRQGGTGEYYKCAVAEAQGHGALAYVVETEDLLSETNTSNIESAGQELNDAEEIFGDDNRYVSSDFDLTPISRTRLRQFRYFDGEDESSEGKELAVPEKVIYGEKIAGFISRVTGWAREKQENLFEKLPRKDGKINLDNFEIYGGSYEDTSNALGRKVLMMQLMGLGSNSFVGNVKQNTETEDNLPPDWGGITTEQVQAEVDEIAAKWNRDYYSVNVKGIAQDNAGEEETIVIALDPVIIIEWDIDEWARLPNYEDMGNCISYLLDNGNGTIANKEEQDKVDRAKAQGNYSRWDPNYNVSYSNSYLDLHSYIGKVTESGGDIIKAIIRINPEKTIGWMKEVALYNYGEEFEFESFCEVLNLIDKQAEGIKEGIEKYFKQEGYIDGGAYMKLAQEIENKELDSYYWDVEYDGEHFEESYEAWAKISYDFDPEDLGVEPRILFEILDSRDFRLKLRRNLTEPAMKEVGSDYYLMIRDKSAVESGEDIRYNITFKVDADAPNELVEQFRELVTGDMDDEDEIKKAFLGALQEEAQKNGVEFNVTEEEEEKVRDFDSLKDLGEVWRRFI